MLLFLQHPHYVLTPPGSENFRSRLTFYCSFIFLFCHGISEIRRPIATKFCIMVCTGLSFENWVQTFGGSLKKILVGKNTQNLV